jgi:hypothetical protein
MTTITDVIEVLREDPEFDATWTHSVPLGDGSLSPYDLSICGRLARAGFTDKQIIAIATAHRLHHDPHDRKHRRADYWQRTLRAARGQDVDVDGATGPDGLTPSRPPGPYCAGWHRPCPCCEGLDACDPRRWYEAVGETIERGVAGPALIEYHRRVGDQLEQLGWAEGVRWS